MGVTSSARTAIAPLITAASGRVPRSTSAVRVSSSGIGATPPAAMRSPARRPTGSRSSRTARLALAMSSNRRLATFSRCSREPVGGFGILTATRTSPWRRSTVR